MDNPTAQKLWNRFLENNPSASLGPTPNVGYFGDNEKDANDLAESVVKNLKKATSHSLLGLQLRKEPLPKIGDYLIVTDWNGQAKCIVKTTSVKMIPFFSINESHAQIEGEGDGTLAYWRKVHWEYYTRELETFNRQPLESMIVVFEQFEKVFE